MKNNNIYKKLFALSLTGVLTLTHPEVSKASDNNQAREVTYSLVPTVTALANVNLKELANPNSKNVGILLANQSLQLCEETNDYYGVLYNGRIVYVYKYNVVQTNQTVMNTPSFKKVRITNSVPMYKEEYGGFLCNIPANAIVDVYLENPNNYFVYYNNQAGYISKVYTDENLYPRVETNPIYYNNPNSYVYPPAYNYQQPVFNQYNYYGPVENNYYYNYSQEQYYQNYDPIIYNNTINYYKSLSRK